MFYQGFKVDKTSKRIEVSLEAKRDFSLYDTDDMKISISAIVGRNGSGKSTIVELIVRAINNLSAALLGEGFNYSKAEHLHYIDDVYVELLFQIENRCYILSVKGRYLSIKSYKWISFYQLQQETERIIIQDRGEECRNRILPVCDYSLSILRDFFYTLVCNYSLYGFNYRDFYIESTPEARLNPIGVKVSDSIISEDSSWLKGLFHKNDGYQTPIVLHPLRNDGQLDIIKENKLAKERMLSMLFYKDEDGEYPMRTINGNLVVSEIRYKPAIDRKFSRNVMLKVLGINPKQNISLNFDRIYNVIYLFWDRRYNIGKYAKCRNYYQDACDYLVYKTLKIIRSYKKYNPIYRYISSASFKEENLFARLLQIDRDKTHVTKKIRKTINYIIAPRFSDTDESAFIEDFERATEVVENIDENPDLYLPPPIFDTDLILEKDLGFINESGLVLFNTDHSADVAKAQIGAAHEFSFSGLSSGEKQIAYTISNILYHMVNVDSEWADVETNEERKNEVQYRYMNIILDEVELYFHPEMQRCFLFLLLKAIRSIKFKNLKGLNILFATHSPFILSDIPGANILHLNEDKIDLVPKTFGGNIMEMLSSTFYMDSSIGEFSRREICKMATFMHRVKSGEENLNELRKQYLKLQKRFKYVCSIIGDKFLRKLSENMIDVIESKLN